MRLRNVEGELRSPTTMQFRQRMRSFPVAIKMTESSTAVSRVCRSTPCAASDVARIGNEQSDGEESSHVEHILPMLGHEPSLVGHRLSVSRIFVSPAETTISGGAEAAMQLRQADAIVRPNGGRQATNSRVQITPRWCTPIRSSICHPLLTDRLENSILA